MTDRTNNFDLLRLLAALQVIYVHAIEHLDILFGPVGRSVNDLVTLFPGVTIFFVVSGFLISRSYENASSTFSYARNRLLRVYPALWVAFAASLALLLAFDALAWNFVASPAFLAWVAGQTTVVQFYNPEALRGFGVGVLNGSLWTIPVELQFYIALPFLYCWCIRGRTARAGSALLGGIACVSYAIWFTTASRDGAPDLAAKLLQVTVLPHLHLFLTGVLFQRHYHRIAAALENRAALWLSGYVAATAAARLLLGTAPNGLPLRDVTSAAAAAACTVLLACCVVSFAYSRRTASQRMLRGHDVSYGVYVYHMLVVNAFVQLGWSSQPQYLAGTVAITLLLAIASWHLVERPALRLKRSTAPGAVTQAPGRLRYSAA